MNSIGKVLTDISYNELKGIKVTFINMPLRETATPNTPPEGPGILAAIVRRYGGEPSILDLNGYRIKDKLAEERGLPNGRHLTYKEVEDLIAKHLDNVGEPICDDNFHKYVLELDDATKILNGKDGEPVNFGGMSMGQFLQAREYVNNDQIEKILEMS